MGSLELRIKVQNLQNCWWCFHNQELQSDIFLTMGFSAKYVGINPIEELLMIHLPNLMTFSYTLQD